MKGILDPDGNEINPLNNSKYSDEYKKLAKIWSSFPAYENAQNTIDIINKNQVILIVSGTGSGKTVLIPKYVLHHFNYDANIAITLPKQIIAQSAAEFAAKTLDVELGKQVGYKYRGSDKRHYNKDNKLIGDNTDWQGFLKSLTYHNINLQDYNIVIIGAGGASRSIIYSLQKEKINDFQIYNRTNINDFKVGDVNYNILDINDIKKNGLTNLLIINCVTASAFDNNVIIPDEIFKNIKIFYDLNYLPSRIHSILENEDIQIISGLDMLIYQAIKSIELWSNKRIIDEINIEEVKKYLIKSHKC